MLFRRLFPSLIAGVVTLGLTMSATAQTVGLPAPRLLTTLPMGGQVGTTFPVTVKGEATEGTVELLFSDPKVTAVPKTDDAGKIVENQFVVTIAADAAPSVCEARVMTRLGISASRAFSIGTLPEVTREKANTSQETAMALELNTICNASNTAKFIDYYTFQCDEKSRIVVECSAAGIDSKVKPVLTISDPAGRDLVVDRRHGILEFTPPQAGQYFIKVHDLTYGGGAEHFYRLAVRNIPESETITRLPGTRKVNSVSLPEQVHAAAGLNEVEPNNKTADAQKVTLPCDIAGAFFPAADVDTYQFDAKKGEVWWVEIASERFGLPTNPFILVQRLVREGNSENWVDVTEFNDIPSPVTVSTGAYSYNGPPYDIGTSDALGKLEIKEDGTYRLQVRDLFGGTRRDPRCVYRLIVRQAQPDFALGVWAQHMELRNGDRSVLSKPMALRSAASMIFEVIAIRKDGFDGPIHVRMDHLPEGIVATGLTIPAGKSAGTLIVSGAEVANSVQGIARIIGSGSVGETTIERDARLASMAWPVRDQWSETPNPRLMADVAVSVSAGEAAPLTIAPVNPAVIIAKADEKLTIPLKLTWRGEFSGALKLKPAGVPFAKVKPIDVPLKSETIDVAVDVADLKLAPGEYAFALYGGLVTKYRYMPEAVDAAKEELRLADENITKLTEASQAAAAAVTSATPEKKAESEAAAKTAAENLKAAQAAKTAVAAKLKAAETNAAPKDLVDFVVSEPIRILVAAPENQ